MEFGTINNRGTAPDPNLTKLGRLLLPLVGYIDEVTVLPEIKSYPGGVDLDFTAFVGFNSSGIRKLINFLKQLNPRNLEFYYCPFPLIDAINMIPELLGPGNNSDIIKSVILEYECSQCSSHPRITKTVSDPQRFLHQMGKDSDLCPKCGVPLIFQERPEDTFFLFTEEFINARTKTLRSQVWERQLAQVRHDAKTSLHVFDTLFHGSAATLEFSKPLLNFSLRRIYRLFESLNETSIDEQKVPFHKGHLNPELLAQECSVYARHRGITLIYGGETLPDLECDLNQLERVLNNLLLNALQAAKSTVDFTWTYRDHLLEFCIEDDGPGLPAEISPDDFMTARSVGKPEGKGLGLSQVAAFATLNQGHLGYERRNQRTLFRLNLPQLRSRDGVKTGKVGHRILICLNDRDLFQRFDKIKDQFSGASTMQLFMSEDLSLIRPMLDDANATIVIYTDNTELITACLDKKIPVLLAKVSDDPGEIFQRMVRLSTLR